MSDDEIITHTEAARRTGLSLAVIVTACREGEIPAWNVASDPDKNAWRMTWADALAWAKRRNAA